MSFNDTYQELADEESARILSHIREFIDSSGSRRELAEVCGTSPATVSQLLNGKRRLTLNWLAMFAQACNVSISEMIREPRQCSSADWSTESIQNTNQILQAEIITLRQQLHDEGIQPAV